MLAGDFRAPGGTRRPPVRREAWSGSPLDIIRPTSGPAETFPPMPILRDFERRLEGLVEGFFTKAFRSGVQPVELAKRVLREMDANQTIGVQDIWVPNHYVIRLSPDDHARFEQAEGRLAAELQQLVTDGAAERGWKLVGPPAGRVRSWTKSSGAGSSASTPAWSRAPTGRSPASSTPSGRRSCTSSRMAGPPRPTRSTSRSSSIGRHVGLRRRRERPRRAAGTTPRSAPTAARVRPARPRLHQRHAA